MEEKDLPSKAKQSTDPADAIASIDVHLISTDEVYTRYSCHPTVGLEEAAVQRRSKDGKNVISPPPTQHWKKILNYIFGGFNFLMWIAFVVTTVRVHEFHFGQCFTLSLSSRTSLWEAPALPLSTSGLQFYWYVCVYVMFQFIYAPQMLVIIISATFYAFVDWNASRIMKSIKSLIAHEAAVIRDGKQQLIPATDIVVGDIVVLSTGDRIPADLRIVAASSDLRFDRSLLTGER